MFYIVLVERWERTRKVQPLLAPKPLVLTHVHELALDDHRTVIEKLGFSFITQMVCFCMTLSNKRLKTSVLRYSTSIYSTVFYSTLQYTI